MSNTTPGPFTIVYGLPGFNPALPVSATNVYSTITATGTTATLTGLTAQTGYQFYVVQNCGGTAGSSVRSGVGTFTTNPNPAANDECTTATTLAVATSCTTPVSGSVFGATQSLPATTGCGGTVANDVWYSFVASATALQLTTEAAFTGYYDLRSGACASTTGISCGLMGSTGASSQVVLTGLTMGQTYFLRIYYSSTTAPAAASSGFTLCLTPVLNYCNTGLGGSCGANDVSAVSIAGTTLNATGLTCTTANGQAYTSYPATGANTGTLATGTPYQLSVTMGSGSIASVWIDYNHNLAFEASEWTQLTTSSGTTPVTVAITIPTTAVQGPTGLRIRTRGATNPNGASDACTNFGSGETKDFTITIGAPAACPGVSGLAVTSITATGAVLSFTPTSAATAYTVTYTPAGGTATTQTVTASPVTLAGPDGDHTYSVSIVGNCGAGQTSAPSVISFATICTAAPYVLVNNTTPTRRILKPPG